MTQIIVEALEQTGQRGIINKGWGGLGDCKFWVPILRLFFINNFNLPSFLGKISLCKSYSAQIFLLPVADPKDFIYSLDNVPHDWLFLQCKAVVRLRSENYYHEWHKMKIHIYGVVFWTQWIVLSLQVSRNSNIVYYLI